MGNFEVGLGTLTIGNPGSTSQAFRMTDSQGQTATAKITSGGNLIVHGSAVLGGYGTTTVNVESGGTLDIRGDLQLASSSATGVATLTIDGSTVSARNAEVGTNASDFDSGGSGSSPFPAGQATIRLAGGTLNLTGTSEDVTWPFPRTIYNAGELTLGASDVIQGHGTIAFTNPNGGTLKASGILSPGLSTGDPTGELLIQGDLRLNNGNAPLTAAAATLQIDLGGTGAGQFDVLRITGNAILTHATVTFSLVNGYSPLSGESFYFLPVGGTITGMFSTVIDRTGLGLSLADLSPAPGGGLQLTLPVSAIPEPSTYALLAGLGALGLAFATRRRRRPRRAPGAIHAASLTEIQH